MFKKLKNWIAKKWAAIKAAFSPKSKVVTAEGVVFDQAFTTTVVADETSTVVEVEEDEPEMTIFFNEFVPEDYVRDGDIIMNPFDPDAKPADELDPIVVADPEDLIEASLKAKKIIVDLDAEVQAYTAEVNDTIAQAEAQIDESIDQAMKDAQEYADNRQATLDAFNAQAKADAKVAQEAYQRRKLANKGKGKGKK